MANFTPNYQLHQWEPADNFLRTDFNEDFAKIDAALAKVEADKAARSEVTALQTAVSGKTELAIGTFTGDGGTKTITLGFRPKAVLVGRFGYTTLAVDGTSNNDLTITANGFQVKYVSNAYVPMNYSGGTYLYIAIK